MKGKGIKPGSQLTKIAYDGTEFMIAWFLIMRDRYLITPRILLDTALFEIPQHYPFV